MTYVQRDVPRTESGWRTVGRRRQMCTIRRVRSLNARQLWIGSLGDDNVGGLAIVRWNVAQRRARIGVDQLVYVALRSATKSGGLFV